MQRYQERFFHLAPLAAKGAGAIGGTICFSAVEAQAAGAGGGVAGGGFGLADLIALAGWM